MMIKQGRLISLILIISFLITGCLSGAWTGANLVYDRHNVYKTVDDYRLFVKTVQALYVDDIFKLSNCSIDVAVFHNNIVLAGHVPTAALRAEALVRVAAINQPKRIFNELRISRQPSNALQDTWITTKIRSLILVDSSIDPNTIKITTSDRIVYLIGEMKKDQAEKVVNIARNINGVEKVVKILKYYTYLTNVDLNNA